MKSLRKIPIKHILRIFVGLTFILSSVLKLQTIDSFEIFVFGQSFLSLSISLIFARVIICIELLLGMFLILNIYFKEVKLITNIILIGFTFYLIYLYFKDVENCYCFGEKLKLSPGESIIKNIVLIVFLNVIKINLIFKFKYQPIISTGIILLTIIITFIVSPPDNFYKEKYDKQSKINPDAFSKYILNNDTISANIVKERKVVCLYSPKCKFCKYAEKKISYIINKHDLKQNDFYSIFWGEPNDLEQFYDINSVKLDYTFIPIQNFLDITYGKMPIILLLNNGEVSHKFGFRNIDEKLIVDFFTDN